MFGQGYNQNQQQPTPGGMFGGGSSGFGQSAGGGGFGQLGQNQNPQTPMFGQGATTGGFGNNQGGMFGQQPQTQTGFGAGSSGFGGGGFGGNAPQNQGAQGGFSTFSQAAQNKGFMGGASGFGGGSTGFGQTAGFGGGGLGNNQFQGTASGGGFNQQQQQQVQGIGAGYYKQPFDQSTTSYGCPFQTKSEQINEGKANGPQQMVTLQFHNIRSEQKFGMISNQMMKLLDILAQKSQGPQPSYEALAAQEYQQNQSQYIFAQKVTGQVGNMGGPGAGAPMGGQSGFFGAQQQSGFNNKPGGWGQPNQQQQTPTLFGGGGGNNSGFGQTTQGIGMGMGGAAPFGGTQGGGNFGAQQQNKPLFGGSTGFGAPQQTPGMGMGAGAGGMFGQQNKPLGTPLFGQAQPPQQTPGFGALGQQPTGTLFGQQQQQPTQGMFGQVSKPAFGQPTQTPAFGQAQPTGNLFGAQPLGGQQQSTLFGGQQQQQQQPTGLFGQQPQNNLFGQPTQQQPGTLQLGATGQQTNIAAPQQSTLFGGAKPLGAPSANGNLFGQPAQQQQVPSLFGQPSQPAGGQPGLFGQPAQQQQTLGFMSKPQAAPGSTLFGSTQSVQPSLFGGAQPTQTPSLFGLPSVQPGQGAPSFGQPSALGQNSMFSLSGQQQQQPTMGQPGQQQTQALYYGKMDPYAARMTLLNQVSPLENTEEELKRIYDEIYQSKVTPDAYKEVKELEPTYSAQNDYKATYDDAAPFSQDQERQRFQEARMKKYYEKFQQREVEIQPAMGMMFNPIHGHVLAQPQLNKLNTFRTDTSMANSLQVSRANSIVKDNLYKTPIIQPPKFDQFRTSAINPRIEQEPIYEESEQPKYDSDVLSLQFYYPERNGKQEKMQIIKVHKSRDTLDLYDKVRQQLQSDKIDTNKHGFKLTFKNSILSDRISLKQAGIENNAKLYVVFEDIEDSSQFKRQSSTSALAPEETLPRPPKQGYVIKPDMTTLSRMSLHQLQRVENFTIGNKFGKIVFIGATDLTEVDLADSVDITEGEVEVYDDERLGNRKPQQGEKLNRPAIITLYNIDPEQPTQQENENQLKAVAGTTFIKYDDKTHEWTYRVDHFTKYGFVKPAKAQQQPDQVQIQTGQSQVITSQQPATSNLQDQQMATSTLYNNTYQSLFPSSFVNKSKFDETPLYEPPKMLISQQPIVPQMSTQIHTQPKDDQSDLARKLQNENMYYQNLSNLYHSHRKKHYDELESIASSVRQSEDQYYQTDLIELKTIKMGKKSMELKKQTLDKKAAMEKSIGDRERLFNKMNGKIEKPTMKQSMDYLKSLGVQLKNGVSMRKTQNPVVHFRPTFSKDGRLITLKPNDNKIVINNIPTVKGVTIDESRKTYNEVTDILITHTNIQSIQSAEQLMQGLSIQPPQRLQQQQLMQIDQDNLTYYDDRFTSRLLETLKLPSLTFKRDPKDLFYFLEDMALHFVSKLSTTKNPTLIQQLSQDFYTMCMFNALYGNPNIHLVQLHPGFKQVKNYQTARGKYAQNFKDQEIIYVDKKRKNALIEVLRFICMNEFSGDNLTCPDNASVDKIYQVALEYLLNGDINGALSHLNRFKKFKMAQYVTQCFSNVSSRELLKQEFATHSTMYSKFNKSAKDLVDFITGTYQVQANIVNWMRALCYQLLIKSNPTAEIKETIGQFEGFYEASYKGHNHQYPLLWLLIKYHALNETNPNVIHKQILTRNNVEMYPGIKRTQENRMSFLITLMLQNLSIHYSRNRNLYPKKYQDLTFPDEILAQSCCQYANQLLKEGNWLQAILVSLYIPHTHQRLKKQLVYEILQVKSMHLIDLDGEFRKNFFTVVNQLHIPDTVIASARAQLYFYTHHHEQALLQWKHAKNFQMMHDVFMHRIVPLYFHLGKSLDEVKNQLKRCDIKDILPDSRSNEIYEWQTQGGLMSWFMNPTLWKNQGEISRSFLNADLVRDHNLHRFIWEHMVQIDVEKKVEACETFTYSRNAAPGDMTPMASLIDLYPDYPELSRFYDDYAVQNLPKLNSYYDQVKGQ